jgi:nucleotide-binding universal stress UspA family protein
MRKCMLLPLDIDTFAQGTLSAAIDLAEFWGSSLHALLIKPNELRATEQWHAEYFICTRGFQSWDAPRASEADVLMGRIRDQIFASRAHIECSVFSSESIVSGIVESVRHTHCGAVLMSHRFRPSLWDFFVGSVPQRIAERCDVPVVLLHTPITNSTSGTSSSLSGLGYL